MKRLAVYCGSHDGRIRDYREAARKLGRALAEREIELVYGGARVGLMGVLADTVLEHGGTVIGVFPEWLLREPSREIVHRGLTELHVVPSLHERKAQMAELADAFIAMPGGLGTLEETFETLTWSQLGIHDKRMGFLDVDHYWDKLFAFLEHAMDEGFVRSENRHLFVREADPERLLEHLEKGPSKPDTAP